MASVRIYQPAKTAMQSGRAGTRKWVVEYETAAAQTADPLMGWAGGGDTRRQVRLTFDTMNEAVAYAKRQGLDYVLSRPRERKVRARAYADNFKFGREQNWTH